MELFQKNRVGAAFAPPSLPRVIKFDSADSAQPKRKTRFGASPKYVDMYMK